MIFVILLVFIIIFLLSVYNKHKIPRIIWLLWLQGWDENTPYLIRKVKESWEKYNPTWEIRSVSRDSKWLEGIKIIDDNPAATSDIVRLHLLSKFGGVWADSTMLCMKPLDDWLPSELDSSVWMYHGRENCSLLASWFIISSSDSYMMKKWKESCDEYWKDRLEPHDYFWMDSLWIDLYNKDHKFREEWELVQPKICCEDYGQSHMLAGKVNDKDEQLKKIINETPPHALKLSRHDFIEDDPETNGNFAIHKSITN